MSQSSGKNRLFGLNCPDCGGAISDKDIFCPHCGVNLDEPIPQETPILESSAPNRGFWLTAMLVLWLITNSALGLYYLFVALTAYTPLTPGLLWMILRLIGNVVFLIAIWKWKKWGVYGILGMGFLGVLIVLLAGGNPGAFIGSLIGMVIVAGILYLLLRKVWNQMD